MRTSINNNFDAQLVQHQRNLSQNKDTRKTKIQCKSQACLFFSHNYFCFCACLKKKAVLFHQGRKRVDNNAYSLYIVLSLIIKSVQNDGQKV